MSEWWFNAVSATEAIMRGGGSMYVCTGIFLSNLQGGAFEILDLF